MNFKLKSLELYNFMSFAECKIDFASKGLYLISGFNNKGGDSNGAGKSAILSGILWTLFGKTQSGLAGKDVVRWGERSCQGILSISDEYRRYETAKTYKIIRSTDSLEFFINDKSQIGHKKDIQELINKTFGIDYSLFLTFNIFTKAWSKFITEVGDADRKKLFKSILMLDQLDDAYKKSKEIYANLSVQANKTEGILKQLETTLPELEELLKKNIELAENEERIKQEAVKALEEQKEALKPDNINYIDDILKLEGSIKEISEQKLHEHIGYFNIQLTNISNLIFNDKATISEMESQLKKMATIGAECPTCGQKIIAKNRQIHTRHLQIMRDEHVESLKTNETIRENIEKEIFSADELLNEMKALEDSRTALERKQWEQDLKIKKFEEYCAMMEHSMQHMPNSNYSQLIDMTTNKIDKIKASIIYNQDLFQNYMKEIDYFSYLSWLYSRQGVINLIIEKCFARLKSLTNRNLRKICAEGFRIDISPQKALKSGEYKEEIDIYIWDGTQKIPYAALSAGQAQRVNIAMLCALYEWGKEIGANTFSCLFLDEVLDLSLAERGQEDVLNLIIDLKSKIQHIILITHKENLQSRWDRQIQIIRGEDGISKAT